MTDPIKALWDLNASTRLLNCIRNMEFKSLEELIETLNEKGEPFFLRQPNLGRACLNELKELLRKYAGTAPVGWDHVRITVPTSVQLDQALSRVAQDWGVRDPVRLAKFIEEARDELGTFMDGFGADEEK